MVVPSLNPFRLLASTRFPRLALATFSLLVVGSTLWLWLLDFHGLAYSNDSTSYISAARFFAAHGHFTIYTGTPLVAFPPGFSLVLAVLFKVGLPTAAAGLVLNLVAFAVLVVECVILGVLVLRNVALSLLGTALLVDTTPLQRTYSLYLSEPVFTVLVVAVVIVLVRGVTTHHFSKRTTALVVVLVWCACAWRYTGLTLLAPVALSYFLVARPRGVVRALLRAAAVTVASSLALVAIAVRNLALGSGPLGPTLHATTALSAVPGQIANLVTFEFVGVTGVDAHFIPDLAAVVLGVALLTSLLRALLQRREPLLVAWAFVLVYWAMIIAAQVTNTQFDFNFRLIEPSVPILAFLVLGAFVPRKKSPRRPVGTYATVTLALLMLVVGVITAAGQTLPENYHRHFPVTAVDREVKKLDVGVLVTNARPVYIVTHHVPVVDVSIIPFFCPPSCQRARVHTLATQVRDGQVRVAVFSRPVSTSLRSELASVHVYLHRSTSPRGVVLYRLTTTSAPRVPVRTSASAPSTP